MAQNKENISVGKKGMNRDAHPSQLSGESYVFMLNGNIEGVDGSFTQLQNEPSNILCSNFKPGYKVIGHKVDVKNDRVFFFLTNPTTGISEIGQIRNITCIDNISSMEVTCGCDINVILNTPLEDQEQIPMCNYETIIEDCEDNTCLNFNICHPFRNGTIELKQEKCGDTLYFTDNYNAPRYLQLDNLEIYSYEGFINDCDEEVGTCLDCNKLRIFPLYDKPCIEVDKIRAGGSLKAGTYQFLIAYCDAKGNERTPYFSLTNTVPIFDLSNNILDQSTLDYKTNLGIRLNIQELDRSFAYYKIAVIQTEGLEGALSYREHSVNPISNNIVIVSSTEDKPATTLEKLLAKRTTFEKAKGMTSGNGILFPYGLTTKPEINLQPVVNLMGTFAKWATVQGKEDMYKNGEMVANYKTFMRDEVYPFSIKFFTDKGYETALFPFISRPPTDTDLADIPEGTLNSLEACTSACASTPRNKFWQAFNTAEVEGYCENSADGTTSYEDTEERTCVPTDENGGIYVVDTLSTGTIYYGVGDVYTNLKDFLTINREDIINPTSPISILNTTTDLDDIRETLDDSDDDYSEFTCNPFGENCTELVELDSARKILPYEVLGEVITAIPKEIDEYSLVGTPNTCSRLDLSSATPENDTDFVADFLVPGDIVYKVNTPSNLLCVNASPIPSMVGTSYSDNPVYLQYSGSNTSSVIIDNTYTGLEDEATPTEPKWLGGLHKGARWYTSSFAGRDNMVLQLSQTDTCEDPDDLSYGTTVRVSTFNSCGSTAAITSNIVDITTGDIINLDRSLYSSDDILVTIEPEVRIDVEFTVTLKLPSLNIALSGTSGTANITIAASNYAVTFNTNLSTTASNFVATHAATILSTHGVIVTSSGGSLDFLSTDPLPSIIITNSTGDINGTIIFGRVEVLIDGDSFQEDYDTNFATTTANFVTAHTVALNALGIQVSSNGTDEILFRSSKFQYDNTAVNNIASLLDGDIGIVRNIYLTTPPCSCFNLVSRDQEISKYQVDYTSITFYKISTFTSTCTYTVPDYNGCNPTPYEYGKFSYWESEELYPCNDSLYNSSTLKIDPDTLPPDIKDEFIINYAEHTMSGMTVVPTLDIDGYLVLTSETNFTNKPIRHFKFPCSSIAPFMSTAVVGTGQETFIYPIGFDISNEVINSFLDIAVDSGLISQEDRDSITKYEIYRGDRRTQRSIIAKGLIYDMYQYQEDSKTIYYPNFPYNDLGNDQLHSINHPQAGLGNSKFTFHSPDTHFSKPVLGTEMKVEGYQYGTSEGKFTVVEEHPTWVILGDRAFATATTLAIVEVLFEATLISGQALIVGAAGGVSAPAAVIAAVAFGVAVGVSILFKTGERRQQWLDIFKNLGQPENFAYFYTSRGFYNYFNPNTDTDNMVRGLCSTSYLTEGRLAVTDELTSGVTRINNVDREQSVYLSTGVSHVINYPSSYYTFDNNLLNPNEGSRAINSEATLNCETSTFERNIASPYVSIKDYVPDQYGDIGSINWLGTGACRNLEESGGCQPVFGGDTFISRFSWKRKIPMFLTNAMGVAPLTPFKYSQYANIPSLKFYADYDLDEIPETVGGYLFPNSRTDVSNMDCVGSTNEFYIKQPAKFYLYYYGIPYFLVESDINTWVRYGKREQHERFYPQVSDYVNWTQERNVSIREPNTFFYNGVYSTEKLTLAYRTLSDTFNSEKEECAAEYPNAIIYSEPDNNEDNSFDPWLVFRPFNFTELPTSYGNLIDLHFIESNQLLGRFENQVVLYNRLNDYLDGTNVNNVETGTGSLFKARPAEFNSTDLGYTGTQHSAMISCEYGHYWVDAKRGQVFEMQPGGKGLNEITAGLRNWFKQHLPFKILKSNITNLTTEDIDNNYNGLGITMAWDARFRRVVITKRDYKLIEGCSNDMLYTDCGFYLPNVEGKIELTNTDYFEDCSFTIAYSPILKSWVSYYSYTPDYYISHLNYFQSGKNSDDSEFGVWSHLLTNQSYQVFYGNRYSWIIELPIVEQMSDSIVHNVQYWLDARAYTNEYDYADRSDVGFNTAWIYNNSATSGRLNLITEMPNNLKQKLQYPVHNANSIDILATSKYKKWSFNYIYDIAVNKNSNNPIWINDNNQINKTLNSSSVKYLNTWKNKLQGDWFILRLRQNRETRLNFIFKWQQDKRTFFDG